MNNGLKLDSRQGSVLLACQSQREGIFREYFGGLQRGRGRRGFNNIYTLNIVPSKVFSLCVFFIQRLDKEYYVVPKSFKRMALLGGFY